MTCAHELGLLPSIFKPCMFTSIYLNKSTYSLCEHTLGLVDLTTVILIVQHLILERGHAVESCEHCVFGTVSWSQNLFWYRRQNKEWAREFDSSLYSFAAFEIMAPRRNLYFLSEPESRTCLLWLKIFKLWRRVCTVVMSLDSKRTMEGMHCNCGWTVHGGHRKRVARCMLHTFQDVRKAERCAFFTMHIILMHFFVTQSMNTSFQMTPFTLAFYFRVHRMPQVSSSSYDPNIHYSISRDNALALHEIKGFAFTAWH